MHNPLWRGIGYGDFERMFGCIEAKTRNYEKGDIILLAGDRIDYIGLVLSGSVKISKDDIDGNTTLLTELAASELFGEVFAGAGIDHSPGIVRASEDREILVMEYNKVINTCPNTCSFHSKLIENMLRLLAEKSLVLNQKIEILSKRTTREKLLLFFDTQRGTAKKFTIPYNREELAQYLCVDRSAMSSELSKMRDEGLIHYRKNDFEIVDSRL